MQRNDQMEALRQLAREYRELLRTAGLPTTLTHAEAIVALAALRAAAEAKAEEAA